MSFAQLIRWPPTRDLIVRLARWRVAEKLREIVPHLSPGTRLLDVGTGNGVLCESLRQKGWEVIPMDVADLSCIETVQPTLYDGYRMPFPADRFDSALLITMLHHAHDPDRVLAEARRVARRLLVIEEIYESAVEKYTTYFIDSLFNLEFFGHARSNRTDTGWRATFQRLGLTVKHAQYTRSLGVLRRVTYVLERER